MCHIILSSVVRLTVPHFFTLSHKQYDFQKKKKSFNKTCVFWFSPRLLSEKFLILRIQCDVTINVFMSITRYFSHISMWLEFFLIDLRKIFKCQLSWKSFQWDPSCSMLMGGQTDRYDETNSRLSQFCERAQKRYLPRTQASRKQMKL